MRTTLDLPDPLFRTLKARAAMDGTTLKELVLRFVQRGLNEADAPSPLATRERAPFVVPGALRDNTAQSTTPRLPLDPALLSNAGLHALLDAEDDAKALRSVANSSASAP